MTHASRRHTLRWLSQIGYDVRNARQDEVARMFEREARQWGLTPERLEEMIIEDQARDRQDRTRRQPSVAGAA